MEILFSQRIVTWARTVVLLFPISFSCFSSKKQSTIFSALEIKQKIHNKLLIKHISNKRKTYVFKKVKIQSM